MNIFIETRRTACGNGYELAIGVKLNAEPKGFTKAVMAAAITAGVWILWNLLVMFPDRI